MNSLFKGLFKSDEAILDQPQFKVYTKEDDEEGDASARSGSRSGQRFFESGTLVSLRQIIKLKWSILNDKIFKIDHRELGASSSASASR